MSSKTVNKTPVSFLQEFCVQHRTSPIYTLIEDGSNMPTTDKIFTYEVMAFGCIAEGRGRNKNLAKHNAADILIGMLRDDTRYREELNRSQQKPEVPRDACPDYDAVSVLMDICVDRNLPLAQFKIQQASGQAHAPEFVIECQVASIIRVGIFSSKKGAKQLAAKEMIEVLQNISMEKQIMEIVKKRIDEPPEKLFKRYYELKKEEVQVKSGVKLSDRYLYFVNLNPAAKEKIVEILNNATESDHEKVYLLCREMNWKYEDNFIPDHIKGNVRCVEIFCEYDLCFANTNPEVYTEILDYIRQSLAFQPRNQKL